MRKTNYMAMLAMIILAFPALARDWAVQYYLPSGLGFVSGGQAVLSAFEDSGLDTTGCFLLPFEAKTPLVSFKKSTLSANGGVSLYFEGNALRSVNLTAGVSLFINHGLFHSPLLSVYLSVYPVYELPLAWGAVPAFIWKAVPAEIGIAFEPVHPFYLSLYARPIMVWSDDDWSVVPDVGIALGIHFK